MKRKLKSQTAEVVDASSAEEQSLNFMKKQRSKLNRRRRTRISPIVQFSGSDSLFTALTEVSCDSSIASVGNQNQPEFRIELPRVVTRSYYRKRFKNASEHCNQAPELSDISCVESCSGANGGLKLKNNDVEELDSGSGVFEKSEVSSAPRRSLSEIYAHKVKEDETSEVTQHEFVLAIPAVQKIFRQEISNPEAEKGNSLESRREALNSDEKKVKITEDGAVSEELRLSELAPLDIDLACSEQFSSGGVIDVSEEEVYSSSSSDIFYGISDSEFGSSEYTPSLWSYNSGSQFSDNLIGGEGSYSPTFELFKQLKEQFCKSTISLKVFDDQNPHEIYVMGLEDEQDKESYRMMWKRERRQEYVHDYAGEYSFGTAYGKLVIQQRLRMVQWIIEEANSKELQKETMFLGVNIFDRFLSKGYFENVRNLQIAGIACLTLATRIEENQPYNCIRRMTFDVGGTIYSRSEVVAMEWVVQEVLNFECCRPTLYNFLWFYLKAARGNEKLDQTAKYLAVLTLMGDEQLCYWPSTVAAGLVVLASIATNQDASCHVVASIHARNKDTDLPECIKSLEWLVKYL
ncbi:Cyclin-SDS [Striga hermonthica]|uniref:Cyclin-SDS n=1 Tax=Striga hermonthica TaxID=68872 RepID=A0A9N7R4K3_STRHE|nr:Cyclin-SDS [Striga hermonthica]